MMIIICCVLCYRWTQCYIAENSVNYKAGIVATNKFDQIYKGTINGTAYTRSDLDKALRMPRANEAENYNWPAVIATKSRTIKANA